MFISQSDRRAGNVSSRAYRSKRLIFTHWLSVIYPQVDTRGSSYRSKRIFFTHWLSVIYPRVNTRGSPYRSKRPFFARWLLVIYPQVNTRGSPTIPPSFLFSYINIMFTPKFSALPIALAKEKNLIIILNEMQGE